MSRLGKSLIAALFAAVAIAGCVTEPEETPRVRPGMSREDLRFFLGEPLRIESADAGAEIWYYRVLTPNAPYVDGAAWADGTGSGGVAVGVTPGEKARLECPVYLSAEGRVVEPLPEVPIRGK